MPRNIVHSAKAARAPATYSQAVKAAGLVFVSGTGPHDPTTGAISGATIQEQTRQCLSNIEAILGEAGGAMDKIVSATVILADESDFPGMNEEWLKWFPADPPARQGAKLPVRIPGLKISIAVIAEAWLSHGARVSHHKVNSEHQAELTTTRPLTRFNCSDAFCRHQEAVS